MFSLYPPRKCPTLTLDVYTEDTQQPKTNCIALSTDKRENLWGVVMGLSESTRLWKRKKKKIK